MSKRVPKDINQIAARIIEHATANPPTPEEVQAKLRSDAAKMLGRLGGLKGGKARAEALTAKQRKKIAKNAINARWDKYRAEKSKDKRTG